MNNIHDYTIEQLKISPVNIKTEDEAWIRQTILNLARGHKKGETEIEVFKQFASVLEQQFKAQISTFSPPSEDYKYWKLHLPKDGNFDVTPSRFSVSFYIKRVENS